ncbi:MAG: chemotaxis protein CheX [Proteobacteria bacterium]|nr:chemotaxis protein CheX [Pseudomonadota bacterium]
METLIIEALGASVQEVLATMTMTKVEMGAPAESSAAEIVGEVTGIVGLVGPNSNGTLILSFERDTILQMLENMFGEKFPTLNTEVLDAIGEITNIVCGDLKRRLSAHGFEIAMATPTVVHGTSVRIREKGNRESVSIPFSTSAGRFLVETNLCRTSQEQTSN